MTFNLMGKAVKILKLPTVNYENTPVTIIPAQQGDANSRFVNISLYDDRGDISLGAYTKVVLNATLPDGSLEFTDGEIDVEKNLGICKIAGSMLQQTGKICCDITFMNDDSENVSSLTSQTFYIFVSKSQGSDESIEGSDDYTLLEKLLKEVEELEDKVETAETARENAEESRVTAENSRVSAEQARVKAEQARVAEESERVSAEEARVSAEQSRASAESARVTAEQSRVKAEQARASAETARESEEQKRVTAEQSRASEEQKRVTAEAGRVSAEQSRVTAEQGRVSAEQARVKAEQARVQAEEEREEAEAQRQETIAGMEGTYAKLNQVVRYDAGQDLTDAQKLQVKNNTRISAIAILNTAGWYRVLAITGSGIYGELTMRGSWNYNMPTVAKVNFAISECKNMTQLNYSNVSVWGYLNSVSAIRIIPGDPAYVDIYYVQNQVNRVSIEFDGISNGFETNSITTVDFTDMGTSDVENSCKIEIKTGMSTQGGALYVNGTDINGRIDDIVDGTTTVAKATQATRFYANDTRNDNQPPSWYQNSDNSKISMSEFKSASAIGADSILTDSRGLCILYTIIPWGDSSGGTPIQVAVQSDTSSGKAKMAMRSALNNDSWGAWQKVATVNDIPVTSVAGKTGAVTLSKSDVGLSNVDNTADAAKPVSTAQATAIADAKAAGTSAQSSISSHTANKSNPHAVTKAQVGLGNVDNVKQYSASNPPPYPVTSVNNKTGAVTLSKSDVGLGNVDNTADASKDVYSAQNILPNPDIYYSVNPYGRASGSTIGMYSTALGNDCEASGTNSIALGYNAKATAWISLAVGSSATASGSDAIAIGASTASGDDSIAIGQGASATRSNSCAFGAMSQANGSGNTAIGYSAIAPATVSDTIRLGSSSLSRLQCAVELTKVSDERDKTDIEDITDALKFITKLNPKTYVRNNRDYYISDENRQSDDFKKYGMCDYDKKAHEAGEKKGTRRRSGLLAQEVLRTISEVYGTDNYANIVNDDFYDLTEKPDNIENQYTIAYEALIPFLIGAIKELKAEVDKLKANAIQ